ncbi:MAG: 3-hydroxyacyl-CoA dehydrogenase family protein [Proteobacteria bacterium]|nr:3-hydroxyacyl-CoA dehydrogenase family protein [Pseudomonadota bacterium]NDG98568.1 3-hydroxyacyl-CoA dehydrogenase family protein [Pseudomonadota bacterium]
MKTPPSPSSNPLPERAAVIGAGLMGAGIAVVLAGGVNGIENVSVMSRSEQSISRARARIDDYVADLARHGLLSVEPAIVHSRLRFTTSLPDAVSGVGLVVESVTEDAATKRDLFTQLDDLVPPPAILASNTSALPIAEFAGGMTHRDRVIIAHFLQPAHALPVLEVVRGAETSDATDAAMCAIWTALGRRPLRMRRDEPGFLINRLQHALVREAVRLLADGLATAEDIDAAVTHGLAPRFVTAGPIRQRDVNGLAMHVKVASRLWPELDMGDGARVPIEFLKAIVAAGGLGLENGRGFYDWPDADPAAVRRKLDNELLALVKSQHDAG